MNQALYQWLEQHALPYQRFDHPPVYTCDEARRLCPDLPGAGTKNLFLRDGKGRRHFLVCVPEHKSVDLKALGAALDAKGLSLASAQRLQDKLGITPGSVSLLALVNDAGRQVELVMDPAIWHADAVLAHPLLNTQTLALPQQSLRRFLTLTGHEARVVDVPVQGEPC